MIKPTQLILVSVLLILWVKSCSPNYELQNIETGVASFQNTIASVNQTSFPITYRYPYFTQFLQTPQIAFAINNLQSPNVELTSFYISIRNKNISEVQFLLVRYQSWSLISVNFMIASRNDIYLDSNELSLSNSFNTTYQLEIRKTINPFKSIARVFLNGLVLKEPLQKIQKQTVLNMTIDVSFLREKSIQITLSGSTINQTQKLWFSYLIFEPEMAGFASYGGRISKENFQGIQSSNLHTIIYRSQYKLFGLNGIQLSQKYIGLISSINSELISTLYTSTPISLLTIDYVILGVPPNRMCNCDNSTLKYAYLEQCLSVCPDGTYAFQYRDGSFACLKCSASLNMRLNSNKTGCQCMDGYQLAGDGLRCLLNSKNATANTTVPTSQTLPISSNDSPPLSIQASKSCLTLIPNAYFDGQKCHCKVGFRNISNSCVSTKQFTLQQKELNPIPLIYLTSVVNFTCPQENEIFINGKCECQIGYQRTTNGACQLGTPIQDNGTVNCSENQINNGLGYCVCKLGYFTVGGKCVQEKPCPINSYKTANGTCVCNVNFTNIRGQCSRCPQSQVWIRTQSRCLTFCGENAFFNHTSSQCQCIPNFALSRQSRCQFCPPQKFFVNGYCVSCQINQFYNSTSKQCMCKQEYYMEKNGICIPKCPNNQYYDRVTMSCKCQLSLGRFNGVCQVCPQNYFASPVTQECIMCGLNQDYQEGKCICKRGYAQTNYRACVPCGEVANTFLYNGECATCPGEKIYNGQKCVCPFGSKSVGLKCVQACKSDELMIQSGDCYKCPINEVIINNQCVCRSNYQRINSICQLACPSGSFLYKGRCATCPPNKIYSTETQGCVCQNGYYLNAYDQCERLTVSAIVCPQRKYLDLASGCLDCQSNCINCTSLSNCVKCDPLFLLVNGKCQDFCGNGLLSLNQECDDQNQLSGDGCSSICKIETNYNCSGTPSKCVSSLPQIKCGNGIIETKQECDDANTVNGDGCSSLCVVQRRFQCYGQPSVCKYNATMHTCGNGFVEFSEQCDDGNFNINDGCSINCTTQSGYVCVGQPSNCTKIVAEMKLYSEIKYNINNIYISLQTDQKYQFSSQPDMQNFIKFNYPTNMTIKPSTYCQQRDYPELDVFDCLLLFSSGIPNRAFQVEFYYIVPGSETRIKLMFNVDPLQGQLDKAKNIRRN